MKNKDLDLLKDDEHYYGEVGKKYLSASVMKVLNEQPHLFGEKQEDNINFVKGKYYHTLLLEPEKLVDFKTVDASTRNTKIYKEHASEHGITMLLKEKEELDELKDMMLSKDVIQELIYSDGNEFEVPAIKKIHGKEFKAKADIINHQNELIIDIKTTADISRFKWSANDYYYNSQAWIYREIFGYDMIFIVVCKKTNVVEIFTCSDKFYAQGEERVLGAIENYELFFGEDSVEDIEQFVNQTEL